MKRDIYQKLLEWKDSERRKPLLLKGARQTGKTYILKEFGNNEYENVFYFNFEEESHLKDFFRRDLKPHRIIQQFSTYTYSTKNNEFGMSPSSKLSTQLAVSS
jgi:predicted AAA+ superfamily ATPase